MNSEVILGDENNFNKNIFIMKTASLFFGIIIRAELSHGQIACFEEGPEFYAQYFTCFVGFSFSLNKTKWMMWRPFTAHNLWRLELFSVQL